MIHLTHLLDELTLRVAQIKVGRLTIEELARDASNSQHGDVSLGGLSLKFRSSKLLLCRQTAGQELHHHCPLLICLLDFSNLGLTCLMVVAPELLIRLFQIVGDGIATVLQTVEQRHYISMVHITRARTSGDKLV